MQQGEDWFVKLPKVECHAHLNGSLSQSTLDKLCQLKNVPTFQIDCNLKTITDFFPLFDQIYSLVNDSESIQLATLWTIQEFYQDGCVYLELRSTPRSYPNLSKEDYIQSVLKGISSAKEVCPGIHVSFIATMDRASPYQDNVETLTLAQRYKESGIVGVDIAGNPTKGNLKELVSLIQKAKEYGFYTTVHLGEVKGSEEENEMILSLEPDRIGHGTFLDHSSKWHTTYPIPLEICLSSNVFCQTVSSFKDHHFKDYAMDDHPCILCTDDKLVFGSSLSNEYRIAAETFGLNRKEIWELSRRAIPHLFASDSIKNNLYSVWDDFALQFLE